MVARAVRECCLRRLALLAVLVIRLGANVIWHQMKLILEPVDYGKLFAGALLALGFECVASFPFFFAPGWANGWPGGFTIYEVWSTWLTVTLFVMLITSGVGLGSLVSLFCCVVPRGRRHASVVFSIWTGVWTLLSATACALAFRGIYASTLEMWPNGYPG
jgi:hypothetical protein